MNVLFPIFALALGLVVLALGKRLAVLGAAVGALLGVALLYLFGGSDNWLLMLLIPVSLAIVGFFVAGFAKGIINIVLLVMGALGGAAIVLGFFNIFQAAPSLLVWLLAVLGGVAGLILVRRYNDWAMIILAGLVGALLVTRGLTGLFPSLSPVLGTLFVIGLVGLSIAYQGGFLGGRKSGSPATAK